VHWLFSQVFYCVWESVLTVAPIPVYTRLKPFFLQVRGRINADIFESGLRIGCHMV
jgi:hypothetical protein